MTRTISTRRIEQAVLLAILAGLALIPRLPALPLCPTRYLAGIDCPTCGMTRALWCLCHGQLTTGLAFHPGSLIVLAVIVRRLLHLQAPRARWLNRLHGRPVDITLLTVYLMCCLVKITLLPTP